MERLSDEKRFENGPETKRSAQTARKKLTLRYLDTTRVASGAGPSNP
jgi:hypothetical protein